mmetsp:Transcript_26658/g.62217  ORF Transcript_26658/g.62217 Transcript_26658/m.62217 type:complete len:257 (+) Transcript_26658:292-1062(+)
MTRQRRPRPVWGGCWLARQPRKPLGRWSLSPAPQAAPWQSPRPGRSCQPRPHARRVMLRLPLERRRRRHRPPPTGPASGQHPQYPLHRCSPSLRGPTLVSAAAARAPPPPLPLQKVTRQLQRRWTRMTAHLRYFVHPMSHQRGCCASRLYASRAQLHRPTRSLVRDVPPAQPLAGPASTLACARRPSTRRRAPNALSCLPAPAAMRSHLPACSPRHAHPSPLGAAPTSAVPPSRPSSPPKDSSRARCCSSPPEENA